MNSLQNDLRKAKVLLNVEIIGLNRFTDDDEEANIFFSSGRAMPWLQDTRADNVWSRWGTKYRDVRILDSSNRLVAVYNLTEHDLADSENYETLKQLLITLSNANDSDRDRLPDPWEEVYLHGLSGGPQDDPDRDGFSNFLEQAFGSDPLDAASVPAPRFSLNPSKQFTITFHRWAGSMVDYLAEGSTNLTQWSASTSMIRLTLNNLYDGTGRSKATYSFTKSALVQPAGFLRLNAKPKP